MFDNKAQETLGYYVYALFDSGNPNVPFYIGKGKGNRVFSHVKCEAIVQNEEDPLSPKLELISEIKESGRTIIHKVIRFGLSEDEAFKIEASLIDLVNHILPETLKNEVSGHGVAEGIYDAIDLAFSLSAEDLVPNCPLLLIKIERRWTELVSEYGSESAIPRDKIYQVTKGDWRLSVKRANNANCVLAVARGIVRAVFVPDNWEDAGYDNRKVMIGDSEHIDFTAKYVGKSVAHLFERGSQNPLRYIQC